ncbi:MAG: T9SS type A sorting domain-containing protein, partial [candidate division Zixibacteria bacterium]|nr:T9SS type A sorting domain-containing protein [Candidatus Tariuqbacter arcticus]
TAISYQLQAASYVELVIYDVMGREVAKLIDDYRPAGVYEAVFNASNLSGGVYFARLTAGNYQQTQKLLLIK